ncbi:MAG: 4-demethylwyosine synthase TYW1 [Candidatus Marsarchaeota archaeon]|nr:4-demethylwyosine synthase TYW1 [Candidatus Marsarchaeota archaeon]
MPAEQVAAAETLEREQSPNVPVDLERTMRRQGYHFVGRHSATKICNYTSGSLKRGESCYKHRFYGIRSWRCIQATTAIGCNLACSFCWRTIPEEEGFKWNEMNAGGKWDEPEKIVEGLINEHRRIVTGYKGNGKVDMKRWNESNDPAHVALSLTGEPLFYPKMSQLLKAFHDRGISTFLVTNGTMVNALKALTVMPTQLYVSVQAPNRELYGKVTRAKNLMATWDNFMRFLSLFSGMNTRRVFRLTLVENLNMTDAEGYADLIRRGRPHYVEVKGFAYVGGARNEKRGLSYGQMPRKDGILGFAKKIADLSGYIVADYHDSSNVALLCADLEAAGARIIKFAR